MPGSVKDVIKRVRPAVGTAIEAGRATVETAIEHGKAWRMAFLVHQGGRLLGLGG